MMQVQEELLDINPNSRPGKHLQKVIAIVVHNTANPGVSAMANRNYFNDLKNHLERPTYASAHEIIGLEGEIIRCIPLTEVAYHCGASAYTAEATAIFGAYYTSSQSSPNNCTLGIELVNQDASGSFTQKTLDSAITRLHKLCKEFNINPLTHLLRHYDVTGKICPKYYVDNRDAWNALCKSIAAKESLDEHSGQC